jgi:TPR repeat protein
LARSGNYGAALVASKCVFDKKLACAAQAVDVLLPFAEKGLARPMVLLARAYAQGRGVNQDSEAAKTLLIGAVKRIGDGDALSLYLMDGWQHDDTTPIDDWVFAQMARSADAGDPFAALSAALYGVLKRHGSHEELDARELAWMQRAERSGLASAGRMLAADAAAHRDRAKSLAYLRKWADKSAGAAADLAAACEQGTVPGVPRDGDQAFAWRKRAGMLGDATSMRIVGARWIDRGTPEARKIGLNWIYSAASMGDLDASLDMAFAMTQGPAFDADANESLKRGVNLYRALMAEHDSPRARRAFAVLLMDGHGVDKDPAQARQLLLKDADAGDPESQIALAQAIVQNKLGKGDPAEAWAWARKADAKGNHQAREMIAGAMFSGNEGLPLDRRGALDMIGKLAAAGDAQAGNDLAWYLCTGPDAALRDAPRGLAAILPVVKEYPIAAFQDTQAGCLAATGDFAQAVDVQQRAIVVAPEGAAEMLKRMQERLVLYRKKQAYIEDPAASAIAPPQKAAPASTPAAGG